MCLWGVPFMWSESRTFRSARDFSRGSFRPAVSRRRWFAGLALAAGLTLVAGAGVIALPGAQGGAAVTRADVSLLTIEAPPALAAPQLSPVSHRMSRPLRLTDRDAGAHDLNTRVRNVLSSFGYVAAAEDRLHTLLVRMLAARQSDAYIHAAVAGGYRDGAFTLPESLRMPDGQPDTTRLLAAFLDDARG